MTFSVLAYSLIANYYCNFYSILITTAVILLNFNKITDNLVKITLIYRRCKTREIVERQGVLIRIPVIFIIEFFSVMAWNASPKVAEES